jgi:hypothetical protein
MPSFRGSGEGFFVNKDREIRGFNRRVTQIYADEKRRGFLS